MNLSQASVQFFSNRIQQGNTKTVQFNRFPPVLMLNECCTINDDHQLMIDTPLCDIQPHVIKTADSLYIFYSIEALAFDYPVHMHPTPYSERSYFADKPILPIPKPFLPPVSDNVPRVLYEEKDMECQAKEETIQILNAKIRRLEHLIHLKDVRIEDLHATLQHSVGLGYSNRKR
ncbi:Sperm flagellar protein 1 [Mactra antiquata]